MVNPMTTTTTPPAKEIILRVPKQVAERLYRFFETSRLNMVENIWEHHVDMREARASWERGTLEHDNPDLDADALAHLRETLTQMSDDEAALAQLKAQGILVEGIQ